MTGGFIYSSELLCLGIAVFILFFMLYSKPRRTYIYRIDLLGIVLSIGLILVEFFMGDMVNNPGDYYSPLVFKISCSVFLVLYFTVMCLILLYARRIAVNKRENNKHIIWINLSVSILCLLIGLCFVWFDISIKTYDNYVDMNWFVRYYAGVAIVYTIICYLATVKNLKVLPKVIFSYLMVFIPLVLIILIVQFINKDHIFSAVTYVMSFTIFYIVFHSNPYDDISGCQNEFSFETRLAESRRINRKYSVIYINFPILNKIDYRKLSRKKKKTLELYAKTCRRIEYLSRGIFIYKIDNSTFAIIYYRKMGVDGKQIIESIYGILEEECAKVDGNFYFRMVSINSEKRLKDMDMIHAMLRKLLSKVDRLSGNQLYIAEEKDYEEFVRNYEIEKMLTDIKKDANLDDERVLCYVQPIYNVKEGRFKTAEALMRLKKDDEIIYPDVFIPIAEADNSIHALTLIILNKACRKVTELKDTYDIDAVSINCSSLEFSIKNIDKEILEIIKQNNIEPSYISIELTESAMFDNFDIVLENIERLTKAGVRFYLDDFGTGYSNLERIINCPFYTIKFDKSLLYKSLDDSTMENLVTQMVQIFKKKGFVALVEGVEDEAQSQFAVERGFEYIQGYKYAKPTPIETWQDYLTSKQEV